MATMELEKVRKGLVRGDIERIAAITKLSYQHVSRVLNGHKHNAKVIELAVKKALENKQNMESLANKIKQL